MLRYNNKNSRFGAFLFSFVIVVVSAFFLPAVNSTATMLSSNTPQSDSIYEATVPTANAGDLEKLKQEETRLALMLASIRQQKLSVLRSRPLTIGIIGFGRFGQFIAKSFIKYGNVVGTSRSDYTNIANEMGAKYVPLSNLEGFVMDHELDVIVVAVSIVSFEDTLEDLVPHLKRKLQLKGKDACPLIVDVLSVKEHAREIMLKHLPEECDILSTHPMFGPDSAKNGWQGQTFVYERTRIDKMLLAPSNQLNRMDSDSNFLDTKGVTHNLHENSDSHIEGMDRVERFLSIWEEEGCKMISMSCKEHDEFTANSQFVTHLMGRILGAQGLQATPVDTKGFQNVLKLIETTHSDSFDLFFGLYKYNRNSMDTIVKLKESMDQIIAKLLQKEGKSDTAFPGPKQSCL